MWPPTGKVNLVYNFKLFSLYSGQKKVHLPTLLRSEKIITLLNPCDLKGHVKNKGAQAKF